MGVESLSFYGLFHQSEQCARGFRTCAAAPFTMSLRYELGNRRAIDVGIGRNEFFQRAGFRE